MSDIRPPDPLPVWATDTNYPAGSNSWSGTARKVDPGSGVRAAGFEPTEKPPAQYLNWELGKIGDWITYLADLQVNNWLESSDLSTNVWGAAINYDASTDQYCVVSGTDKVCHSQDGLSWSLSTISSPQSTDIRCVVSNGNGLTIAAGGPEPATRLYRSTDGGVLFDTSPQYQITGTPSIYAAAFVTFLDKFVITGNSLGSNTAPAVWTSSDGTTWAEFVLNNASPTCDGAAHIAASPSRAVVACDGETGYWYSDNGTTWTRGNFAGTSHCHALTYNDTDGLFMMIDNGSKIFTSSNGTTWVQVATLTGGTSFVRKLISYGPIYIASKTDEVGGLLVYSTDKGLTWRSVLTGRSKCQALHAIKSGPRAGKLLATYSPGSGTGHMKQSLRLGQRNTVQT